LDGLEKVHRNGVDVDTALLSPMKRFEATRGDRGRRLGARRLESAARGLPTGPRRWLGSLGRSGGAAAKLALRPLMVRIRQFMLAPLEEEIRLTRQRVDEIGEYAGRVAVPVGDWDVLLRTNAGYVLCSAADQVVLASLMSGGDLERGTRLLIERLVRPGDVVIDAGAHLGLHTLAAGRALRGRGRVHAFEPFEPTTRRLRQAVVINGLSDVVEVHEAAVSRRTGSQPLFMGAISGHHSLYPLSPGTAASEKPVDVALVRLDDAVPGDGPVSLMKLDVEGAELEALEGATAIIERSPEIAVIAEFGPSHLARVGTSTPDWFARFEAFGLTFRMIDPETGRLRTSSIGALETLESANLLFARPEARAWTRA
jgi:FkbM family methyltransferase